MRKRRTWKERGRGGRRRGKGEREEGDEEEFIITKQFINYSFFLVIAKIVYEESRIQRTHKTS